MARVKLHPSVSEALSTNAPIVALESTILTHGLPYPENLDLSRQLTALLRSRGAIPATIAVLSGVPHVGLSTSQLTTLCKTGASFQKLSTHDLPFAYTNNTNGSTTVASTMAIASSVSIRVFCTGGIGGVHDDVTSSWDISSDLTALSTYPVFVISAGAKSILDVPKTLQVLETASVPVFVLDHPFFPEFYTRGSRPAHAIVKDPQQAATAFHAALTCPTCLPRRGALLAVPIPEQYQPDVALVHRATQRALEELRERPAISARHVTPFLLRRVAELTNGASVRANIKLVLNNARVAAEVAIHLSRLLHPPRQHESEHPVDRAVVVAGAAALDVHCRPTSSLRSRVSNKGKMRIAAGGVANNVAEALVYAGTTPTFFSAVGDDATGRALLADLRVAGLPTDSVRIYPGNTPSCALIMETNGELSVAVADMDFLNEHSIIRANEHAVRKALSAAKFACADANLSVDDLQTFATLCAQAKVPFWFEPTTAAKCAKIVDAGVLELVAILSPNGGELKAIAERLGARDGDVNGGVGGRDGDFSDEMHDVFAKVVLEVGGGGVRGQRIFCTRGVRGVTRYSFVERDGEFEMLRTDFPAVKIAPEKVVSTTGAGDCFAGACLAAFTKGLPEAKCITNGIQAAAECCLIEEAVPRRTRSKL